MKTTFDSLLAMAQLLQRDLENAPNKGAALVLIMKTLSVVHFDSSSETLEAVENRLLHQEHQ